MPKIIYHRHSGKRLEIDANVGQSVMEAAVKNGVGGILGECGGACACATCHVYVAPSWSNAVGGPGTEEEDLLEFAASPQEDNSRLSCQITMTEELDGLEVLIPENQG